MLDIKHIDVSFTCTNCKRRSIHQLPCAITQKRGKPAKMRKQSWCTLCNTGFEIEYVMKRTRKGIFKLKVLEYKSRDVVHRKRFTVVQPHAPQG